MRMIHKMTQHSSIVMHVHGFRWICFYLLSSIFFPTVTLFITWGFIYETPFWFHCSLPLSVYQSLIQSFFLRGKKRSWLIGSYSVCAQSYFLDVAVQMAYIFLLDCVGNSRERLMHIIIECACVCVDSLHYLIPSPPCTPHHVPQRRTNQDFSISVPRTRRAHRASTIAALDWMEHVLLYPQQSFWAKWAILEMCLYTLSINQASGGWEHRRQVLHSHTCAFRFYLEIGLSGHLVPPESLLLCYLVF